MEGPFPALAMQSTPSEEGKHGGQCRLEALGRDVVQKQKQVNKHAHMTVKGKAKGMGEAADFCCTICELQVEIS